MNLILDPAQNTNPSSRATAATATATAPRFDMYASIHKALRLAMGRALQRVGSTDPDDTADLAAGLQQLLTLLVFCESHLEHEDAFLHPAMERAQPGTAAAAHEDHLHHREAIADLRDLAGLVANSRPDARAAALLRLYRALSLFVADNLQHMHVEETAHNAVLWAHYSDAELAALHDELVASVPPPEMVATLRWMLPAMNAPERAGMLGAMRAGMPPEAFLGVLDIARETLPTPEHTKLARALGVAAVPGLVAA